MPGTEPPIPPPRGARRNDDDIAERLQYFDPAVFARARLGFIADPWQKRFLRSIAPEIVVNCCRQSGKSTTAAVKALHKAMFEPDSLTLIISPTQRQSGLLLRKIRRFLATMLRPPGTVTLSAEKIELANGSAIVSLPGNDDGIRGYSAPDLIIEDEAAFVPDETHDAVIPMLAVSRGQLLLLSTPQGRQGHFYEACCSETSHFERFTVTAEDCPRIPRDWLERQRLTKPSRYGREFQCTFLEADNQFFSYEEIEKLFDTDFRPLFPEWNEVGSKAIQNMDGRASVPLYGGFDGSNDGPHSTFIQLR